MRLDRTLVISFSGIDGAGKSTQIQALGRYLDDRKLRFSILTFWDDVVALSSLREHASITVFKGDPGVGSRDRPIVRRDKNVSSWYVVIFRLFLYLLDALQLSVIAARRKYAGDDVMIFDRYIYDELANLPLERPGVRFYVRCILKLIPKPDIAFLIDADPYAACARKPEYPLVFVIRNREAYLALAKFAGMKVLAPQSIESASAAIERAVESLCRERHEAVQLPTEYSRAESTNRTAI